MRIALEFSKVVVMLVSKVWGRPKKKETRPEEPPARGVAIALLGAGGGAGPS